MCQSSDSKLHFHYDRLKIDIWSSHFIRQLTLVNTYRVGDI